MNNVQLWSGVSRLLALIATAHTGVILLSKLLGLPKSEAATRLGKLVECAALLALISTSSSVVTQAMSWSELNGDDVLDHILDDDAVSEYLLTYLAFAGVALAGFALLRLCFARPSRRGFGGFLGWLAGIAGAAAICALFIPFLQFIYPEVPFNSMARWAALEALLVSIGAQAAGRLRASPTPVGGSARRSPQSSIPPADSSVTSTPTSLEPI